MTDEGPPPYAAFQAERERLFLEIDKLRRQRDDLMVRLIECQHELRELRSRAPSAVSVDSQDSVPPEAQDDEHE